MHAPALSPVRPYAAKHQAVRLTSRIRHAHNAKALLTWTLLTASAMG